MTKPPWRTFRFWLTLAAITVSLAAVFMSVSPSVNAATTQGTCTLSENASGNLVVAGSGLEGNYQWGWGLYAEGVTPPAGYTPWLDYGSFTTAPDGTWAFTMNTVSFYEQEYPNLGPYPLGFYVLPEHGSKNVIGTNNLTTHQDYDAYCTFG